MAIGIFDSGLGGLSILQAARLALPDQHFIYFGDNAHAPYGTRDPADIIQRTQNATHYLWANGCDLVILACNTASAIALRPMQTVGVPPGKRVLGVFVPMIEALSGRAWGDDSPPTQLAQQQVALFATPATVTSQAFPRELALRARGVVVHSQPCTGLVDAIEANDTDLVEKLIDHHVSALHQIMPKPDVAVLGCTHYPLVQAQFQAALGQHVRIISQPDLVAESLADYLNRHPDMQGQAGSAYLTTGDPMRVSAQATRFMNAAIEFQGIQP